MRKLQCGKNDNQTGFSINGESLVREISLALILIFGFFSSVASAEMIIVSVSGTDNFQPGEKLDDTSIISLPKGAKITVLHKTGDMQVVTGPQENQQLPTKNKAEDTPTEQWEMLSSILGHPDKRAEVFGVSRKFNGNVPATPRVWHVSVDSSGPRCIQSSQLVLWRSSSEKQQNVSIRSATGRLKDISWAEGQKELPIPDTFTLSDGRLAVSVGGALRELDLHITPPQIANGKPGALLGWLLDKKCYRQALSLIEHVHMEAEIK